MESLRQIISPDFLLRNSVYTSVLIVSAINLNYRALDTLGEATMLFACIVGVLAVARKIGRKG